MNKTSLFWLAVMILLPRAVACPQEKTKPALSQFEGLQLKNNDGQRGDSRPAFPLNLERSEAAQLSEVIKVMESSSGDVHNRSFLFVTSSKGKLLFSTTLPGSDKLPRVLPFIGEFSAGNKHVHPVLVDPKALDLLRDRGCGPGSICGPGNPNPSPPPNPVPNPCGPGSMCGPGGGKPPLPLKPNHSEKEPG
jgi:hypothetical protein